MSSSGAPSILTFSVISALQNVSVTETHLYLTLPCFYNTLLTLLCYHNSFVLSEHSVCPQSMLNLDTLCQLNKGDVTLTRSVSVTFQCSSTYSLPSWTLLLIVCPLINQFIASPSMEQLNWANPPIVLFTETGPCRIALKSNVYAHTYNVTCHYHDTRAYTCKYDYTFAQANTHYYMHRLNDNTSSTL